MVQPLRDDRQQIFSTSSMQENNGRSSVNSTQQMAANWSTLQNAIQNQNKGPLICLLTIFLTVFLVLIGLMLLIPILEIALGTTYRKECTINSNIPVFLIVAGSCVVANFATTIVAVRYYFCKFSSK